LKALKRNQQLVYECDKKCVVLQVYMPPKKVGHFIEMEKDKCNALLYSEFEIDNYELEAAIEKFALLETDEIKNFVKLVNA